jgi:hypothetical protein
MLPILIVAGDVNPLPDDLQRLVNLFPDEGGSQNGLCFDDPLPGFEESGPIELTRQRPHKLLKIGA